MSELPLSRPEGSSLAAAATQRARVRALDDGPCRGPFARHPKRLEIRGCGQHVRTAGVGTSHRATPSDNTAAKHKSASTYIIYGAYIIYLVDPLRSPEFMRVDPFRSDGPWRSCHEVACSGDPGIRASLAEPIPDPARTAHNLDAVANLATPGVYTGRAK